MIMIKIMNDRSNNGLRGDKNMELKCKKCNYKWKSRIKKIPKECPDCKSRKWNKG